METILLVLVIWFLASIVASLFIGRFLGAMNRRQADHKPLTAPTQPRHAVADVGLFQIGQNSASIQRID